MNNKWFLGWLVLLAACSASEEVAFQHHLHPIINGKPDRRLDHMAVVAVLSGVGMCSGTLIAPRVVLTAAHCTEKSQPRDFLVLFGLDTRAAITRGVAEFSVHSSYQPQGETSPGDIALLLLSDGPPPGVEPLPHLPATMSLGDGDVGREIQFVGFGEDENGSSGTKLYADATIDLVCTTPGGCRHGQYFAEFNTICQDQVPSGICFGDSGGPALVVADGREYVAGVSSYVYTACRNWGCSTKVDAYTEFIESFISGRPGQPCREDAECRSGVCSGGVCCEQACPSNCASCAIAGSLGSCRPVPDDTPCPDGDACNGQEHCQAGVCLAGSPLVCEDGNPCTEDRCFPTSGCVFRPLADGAACSDGDACNGEESCLAGLCLPGDAPQCDDQNSCTEDVCLSESGCVHRPLEDDSACGESLCGRLACRHGECRLVEPISCDDGNPCTEDSCSAESGCRHQELADGMKCGFCQVCRQGRCVADTDCKSSGCGCAQGGVDGSWPPMAGLAVLLVYSRRRSAGRARKKGRP